MARRRKIEVFSAGCLCCGNVVERVRALACPSCDVAVLDMADSEVSARAKALGVRTVPAVVIDGALAGCCQAGGPDEATLQAAGLGQPLG